MTAGITRLMHVFTCGLTAAIAGTCAAQPPQLDARSKSWTLIAMAAHDPYKFERTLAVTPLVIDNNRESELEERLTLDFGVQRVGPVSRALRTDGLLAELVDDNTTDFGAPLIAIQGVNGPVRFYDARVAFEAAQAGPVEFSLLGGVRAIGLSREWSGVPGASLSLDDDASDEIIPVPVIGGAVSVAITDRWRLSGQASQGPYEDDAYFDLRAQSEWSITPRLDVIAGYQFIDAAVRGDGLGAHLSADGVYARLRLRY